MGAQWIHGTEGNPSMKIVADNGYELNPETVFSQWKRFTRTSNASLQAIPPSHPHDLDAVLENSESIEKGKEKVMVMEDDGSADTIVKRKGITKIEKERETEAATESGSLTWPELRERLDDVELIIYVLKKKRKRLGKAMIDKNLEEEVYEAIRFLKEEANIIVYQLHT